jgi:phosphoglucosamine mutase
VKADVGIALDGDGDRVVMCDEHGAIVDGDQMLYILAKEWHELGQLKGPVVGTVMSNLGLEHALTKVGIDFQRAKVGDRYVLEALRETGGNIGGETSGHMLVLDRTTTGDGLVCALQILAIMKRTGNKLSELAEGMSKYPQTMVNVRTTERFDPAESVVIREAVVVAEQELADTGRVVLRASGTEPLIRVMVEGEDHEQVVALAERLAAVVADATA